MGYAPTYYPGTNDLGRAIAVELKQGEQKRKDLGDQRSDIGDVVQKKRQESEKDGEIQAEHDHDQPRQEAGDDAADGLEGQVFLDLAVDVLDDPGQPGGAPRVEGTLDLDVQLAPAGEHEEEKNQDEEQVGEEGHGRSHR